MEEEIQKELIEKGLGYADEVIVPPLQEIGGIFADTVRFWRYKNQLRIASRAKDLHLKHGISSKKIPVKTLASLMEYSSLEENETLQDMWVNLLANATDSRNDFNNHLSLISILKELSPEEALVLNYMWRNLSTQKYFDISLLFIKTCEDNNTCFSYSNENIKDIEWRDLIVENLIRLKLIKNVTDLFWEVDGTDKQLKESSLGDVFLSNLGVKLIEQCNMPN